MKKYLLIIGYFTFISFVLLLNSCTDDPIEPNLNNGNYVDTTWVSDSTVFDPIGGGNPIDSTGCGGGIPNDSTGYDPGGGGLPTDSTGWNPADSTGN